MVALDKGYYSKFWQISVFFARILNGIPIDFQQFRYSVDNILRAFKQTYICTLMMNLKTFYKNLETITLILGTYIVILRSYISG